MNSKKEKLTNKLKEIKYKYDYLDVSRFNCNFGGFGLKRKELKNIIYEFEKEGLLTYQKRKRIILFDNNKT